MVREQLDLTDARMQCLKDQIKQFRSALEWYAGIENIIRLRATGHLADVDLGELARNVLLEN